MHLLQKSDWIWLKPQSSQSSWASAPPPHASQNVGPWNLWCFSIDRETRKTWTKSYPSCHSFDSCQAAPSFGPAMNRHEKKPNSPSVLHDFVSRPSWSPMRVQGVVKNVQIVTPSLISTILISDVRISTCPYCIHFVFWEVPQTALTSSCCRRQTHSNFTSRTMRAQLCFDPRNLWRI